METLDFCRILFEETRFMNITIKSTLSKIVAKHDLNPYQAHLLGDIASQDGQTIKQLASHLCVKPSNFRPIIEPLSQCGFIERRQDENDKRSFRIYLTEEGRKESAAIDAEFAAYFENNASAEELQRQVIKGFEAFRQLVELSSELGAATPNHRTRKEN